MFLKTQEMPNFEMKVEIHSELSNPIHGHPISDDYMEALIRDNLFIQILLKQIENNKNQSAAFTLTNGRENEQRDIALKVFDRIRLEAWNGEAVMLHASLIENTGRVVGLFSNLKNEDKLNSSALYFLTRKESSKSCKVEPENKAIFNDSGHGVSASKIEDVTLTPSLYKYKSQGLINDENPEFKEFIEVFLNAKANDFKNIGGISTYRNLDELRTNDLEQLSSYVGELFLFSREGGTDIFWENK